MRSFQRLLWSISAAAVILVIAAPAVRAQCDPLRTFTSINPPGPPQPRGATIVDATGSRSATAAYPLVVGRFWAAGNAEVGNNFSWGANCPADSASGGWWVVPPGSFPHYRGLDGEIGNSWTTPECSINRGCPWPDDLVVVVEDWSEDATDAFLLVWTAQPTMSPWPPTWDFRGRTPPDRIVPFQRFPKMNDLSTVRVGSNVLISFQPDDLAQNYRDFPETRPPFPASYIINSYDVYAFHGPEDPGRDVSHWELVDRVPYNGTPGRVYDIAVTCSDLEPSQIQLALGVSFDGGMALLDVRSTMVGEAVTVCCAPPPSPGGVWTSIGEDPHEDVVVSWDHDAECTDHYRILRAGALNGETYSVLHDTSSDPDPLATTWTDVGAAEDGQSYFYKIEAVGTGGLSSVNPGLIAAKIPYQLPPEWNLVSFPLDPHDDDEYIRDVLETLDWGSAQYWDPAPDPPGDNWRTHNPHLPPDFPHTLQFLNNSMGFFVYVEGPDDSWRVTGTVPTDTKIEMKTGWNMIGFPRLAGGITVGDLKGRIETENPGVTVLEVEDDIGPMQDNVDLRHGLGYWVELDQDASITLTVIDRGMRVNASDIFVVPAQRATNQVGTVGVTVHNVGDSASLPFTVSFYEGETLIDTVHVASIPVDSSTVVGVPWDATPDAVLRVVLDYNASPDDGIITEASRIWTPLNEMPLVTCHGPIAGTDPGECSASVGCANVASCSDADGDATVQTCEPAETYPVGASNVTVRCSDGLHITTAFCTVTVEDEEPPAISAELLPLTLWPPNHRMVDVSASVTATDACGISSVVLTSVTCDEPDNGEGDGDTVDDVQGAQAGTADMQFGLRAERAADGDGRIYTAAYTATDGSGNVTVEACDAVVPHDQGGVTEPIDLLLDLNENGTLVSWSEAPGAQSYDVIRGQLGNVAETDVLIHLGAVTCIEQDSPDGSTAGREDPDIPDPGEAFFYLVEYFDGTSSGYGTESASKPRAPGAGDCD